ncbi:MAG: multiheme c-type cytochrome [Vicinamibacterales bacterium]|nr:multiheme c-type cytochrome [Vicinamibacterales bacterium]
MHRRPSLSGALFTVLLSTACLGRPDSVTDLADALADATYAGSDSCQACHGDIHARWENTLMAKVLQDPREQPDVILGDFAANDPLVTFTPEDVVFTYGSKWKQRYYTQIGDDYFIFPAQWDVQNRQWRGYNPQPGRDWWADHYPVDQMQRPTGPLCDGCHSVNYDIATKTPTEWNVGCEACHGPGSVHNVAQTVASIVNPARLDPVRADDTCIQCHSQGQPLENPINGQYYDWPVGYRPGERLSEYWELDGPELGEETFTHWPDGSAHKNRMQGNDYIQSQMSVKGVTCYGCHDVHGTEHNADLIAPGNETCLECHGPQLQAGPRGSVAYHTQHDPDGEGSACVACHMPEIARTVGNINVRSHTFKFISPTVTDRYGIPNPCTTCHEGETTEWAIDALETWPQVSPWRVAQ